MILPLALTFLLLAFVVGSVWYAVRNWPLPDVTTPHLAAVLAAGIAGLLALVWGMAARGDWTPGDGVAAVLAAVLVPVAAILLAGGREDVAAKVAQGRAEAAAMIRERAAAGRDVPLRDLADEIDGPRR